MSMPYSRSRDVDTIRAADGRADDGRRDRRNDDSDPRGAG